MIIVVWNSNATHFELKSVTFAIIGGTIDIKILISLAPATKV